MPIFLLQLFSRNIEELDFCLEFIGNILMEGFDPMPDVSFSVGNLLVAIYFLHSTPLEDREIFTITFHLQNFFKINSLEENRRNTNFTYDTEIIIFDDLNFLLKFQFLRPSREYWG